MTEVEIANLALAHIGQRGTITSLDPPDASEHAERAAQFIDHARDSVLERHPWGFATRRVVGSELVATIVGWDHVYAQPAECLEVLAVLPPTSGDDYSDTMGIEPGAYGAPMPVMAGMYTPQRFVVETLASGETVVLTDCANAVLRYKVRIADLSKWPALAKRAMSYELASMLAGPIIKGDAGTAKAAECAAQAERLIAQAIEQDTRQREVKPVHRVPWIAAR